MAFIITLLETRHKKLTYVYVINVSLTLQKTFVLKTILKFSLNTKQYFKELAFKVCILIHITQTASTNLTCKTISSYFGRKLN